MEDCTASALHILGLQMPTILPTPTSILKWEARELERFHYTLVLIFYDCHNKIT